MADRPPSAGWQRPEADGAPPVRVDPELLLELVELLRERVPAEVSVRVSDAVRELLLALRGLIDAYLERSEPERGGASGVAHGRDAPAPGPSEVRDIPIS